MNEADLNRLSEMLAAALKAQSYVYDQDRIVLDKNEMLALAVTRLLEIIGEAARNVSEETQFKIPELPWPAIIGMRHRIAHDYLHVDYDVIWDTLIDDLPKLVKVLQRLLPPNFNGR